MIAVMLCVACARRAPEGTPSQLPVPIVTSPAGAKIWTMAPWNGVALYHFSRSGSVSSDSAEEHAVTASSSSDEILTRAPAPRGTSFALSIARAGGSEGPPKPAERVSGSLTALQLTLDPSPGAVPCDATRAQLRADLADLAVPATATIARGESWTDLVSNELCISGIAGTARTRRTFLAAGDTTFAAATAVIVLRTDSASLSAEGALEGHVITLLANGTAKARIYLSVPGGKVLRIEKQALLRIAVTSSSQTRNFVQRSTSVGELGR